MLPHEVFDALTGKLSERLSSVQCIGYREQMVALVRKRFMQHKGEGVIPLTIQEFKAIRDKLETKDTI